MYTNVSIICCLVLPFSDVNSFLTASQTGSKQNFYKVTFIFVTAGFCATQARKPFHFLSTPHEDHILKSCPMHTVWHPWIQHELAVRAIVTEYGHCRWAQIYNDKDPGLKNVLLRSCDKYKWNICPSATEPVGMRIPLEVFFTKTIVGKHWVYCPPKKLVLWQRSNVYSHCHTVSLSQLEKKSIFTFQK